MLDCKDCNTVLVQVSKFRLVCIVKMSNLGEKFSALLIYGFE